MRYYTKGGTSFCAGEFPAPSDEWEEITEGEYSSMMNDFLVRKAEAIGKGREGRIRALKRMLCETDYKAIKFAEGEMSAEEYAPTKALRAEWRKEINELEERDGKESDSGMPA